MSIKIYAAGSLRYALPAIVAEFKTRTGVDSVCHHGPAGFLCEKIENGDQVDLFASADFGYPERLAAAGRSGPTVIFARNRMVVTSRPEVGLTRENLIERLLDPAVKIGTSTPGKDPGGDYAWEVFRKIGALRPGAFDILAAKAQQLVGASDAPAPSSRGPAADYLSDRTVDVFFGYATAIPAIRREMPEAVIIEVPGQLVEPPAYALTILKEAQPEASALALFMVSIPGQRILRQFGFSPVALPTA